MYAPSRLQIPGRHHDAEVKEYCLMRTRNRDGAYTVLEGGMSDERISGEAGERGHGACLGASVGCALCIRVWPTRCLTIVEMPDAGRNSDFPHKPC